MIVLLIILIVISVFVVVIDSTPIIVDAVVEKKKPSVILDHDKEAKIAWRCMWEFSLCLSHVFLLIPQLSGTGNDDAPAVKTNSSVAHGPEP